MKIDLLRDIVFPTVQIRQLARGEKKPKTNNWVNVIGETFVFEFDRGQEILDDKIQKMLDPLRAIVEYQLYNRQVGHTQAMLNGAGRTENIFIVVGNSMQGEHIANRLHKEWGVANPKNNIVTLDALMSGKLAGHNDRPMVLDNVALYELFARMGGNVRNLEERKGEFDES